MVQDAYMAQVKIDSATVQVVSTTPKQCSDAGKPSTTTAPYRKNSVPKTAAPISRNRGDFVVKKPGTAPAPNHTLRHLLRPISSIGPATELAAEVAEVGGGLEAQQGSQRDYKLKEYTNKYFSR